MLADSEKMNNQPQNERLLMVSDHTFSDRLTWQEGESAASRQLQQTLLGGRPFLPSGEVSVLTRESEEVSEKKTDKQALLRNMHSLLGNEQTDGDQASDLLDRYQALKQEAAAPAPSIELPEVATVAAVPPAREEITVNPRPVEVFADEETTAEVVAGTADTDDIRAGEASSEPSEETTAEFSIPVPEVALDLTPPTLETTTEAAAKDVPVVAPVTPEATLPAEVEEHIRGTTADSVEDEKLPETAQKLVVYEIGEDGKISQTPVETAAPGEVALVAETDKTDENSTKEPEIAAAPQENDQEVSETAPEATDEVGEVESEKAENEPSYQDVLDDVFMKKERLEDKKTEESIQNLNEMATETKLPEETRKNVEESVETEEIEQVLSTKLPENELLVAAEQGDQIEQKLNEWRLVVTNLRERMQELAALEEAA